MEGSPSGSGASISPELRGFFEQLPDPALLLLPNDPTYTIVAGNRAYDKMGLSDSDGLTGRGLFDVLPESAADLAATLRQVLETRSTQTSLLQKAAAERYWRSVDTPVMEDGRVRFILHRVEEVSGWMRMRRSEAEHQERIDDLRRQTDQMEAKLFLRERQLAETQSLSRERQEVEARLLALEGRYTLAFVQAPIGMVLLSPAGVIVEVNQAFLDMLGYTRDQLVSRDSSSYTHPADRELTRKFFEALHTENHSVIEKRYFRKDGQILWTRASGAMRRDDAGNPVEVIAIVEDITERKLAQEQLWASKEQLRAIYDGTYEYIGLLSPDGKVLDCNRASLEFANNTREEVIGQPLWETPWVANTPGAPERLRESIAEAAAGNFVRYEAPLQRPNGTVITFDFSLYPVRNERGEVIFLVPEGRDVTERNRAAEQIETDRGRWRELLKQTPAGIALLRGPDHVFDWVNPAYERLAGRPAAALLGKPVREAIPEVDQQVYLGLLDGVYRTGEPFVGHEALVRLEKDGVLNDFYMNFVYLPTRDLEGVIDGIFVHVTDVTDTVLARKRIEESERQFRTLAETIPHLAWIADEAGNRYWYNRRWYDYTGTTFEEVKGWGWQNVHDPAVLPEVMKRWHGALSSGDPFEMVCRVKGADGDFRPFLTRVAPVKDMDGRVVKWFGTNTDIMGQQQTEQELRRMNRELEEFAYVASHDLQEPLRMVNIYTQMILRNRDSAPEVLNEYAGFVTEGVHRMEALIHDLLTFSRSVHLEAQPFGTADLAAALHEALSVLKGRIDDAGAAIEAAPLPEVRGETQQLTHVFQNVLSNALKYRRANTPLRIQIAARRSEDQWIISIRDNGIGFEAQYAERIFGLFKRLHKDEYPGTGLGLAICKRIVERYGGRMWAEGDPGSGAAFYFSLPAIPAEPAC